MFGGHDNFEHFFDSMPIGYHLFTAELINLACWNMPFNCGNDEFGNITNVNRLKLCLARKKALVSVPFALGSFIGGIFGLLGKIPMIPTVTTSEQVKMLKKDCIVSEEAKLEGRTLEGVGITPRAMEAVLPSYLWRFRPHGQFAKNTKNYRKDVKI